MQETIFIKDRRSLIKSTLSNLSIYCVHIDDSKMDDLIKKTKMDELKALNGFIMEDLSC